MGYAWIARLLRGHALDKEDSWAHKQAMYTRAVLCCVVCVCVCECVCVCVCVRYQCACVSVCV